MYCSEVNKFTRLPRVITGPEFGWLRSPGYVILSLRDDPVFNLFVFAVQSFTDTPQLYSHRSQVG